MHGQLTAIAVVASLCAAACGPPEPPKTAPPVVEIAAAPSAAPSEEPEPPRAEDEPRRHAHSPPPPKKPTPKEEPHPLPPVVASAPSVAAAPPGNATQIAQARQLFKEGVEHFQNGRYADARDAFLAAYQTSPHPQVLFNASMAAYQAGDVQVACQLLQRWKQGANPSPAQLANVNPQLAQRCP